MSENNSPDMVNNPPHYTIGGIDTLTVIKAKLTSQQYEGMLVGNCIKYLLRYQHKGRPVQDLKKAQFYLNRLINELKDNDNDRDSDEPETSREEDPTRPRSQR